MQTQRMLFLLHLTPVMRQDKKNDNAGDSTYDKLAKRVSENPHTSLTNKEDRPRKSRKRKINSPSSCPEIVKRPNKKERKK